MRTAHWRDLKRDNFADPAIRNAVAVLPIAAIEQHGPHLPTGTDAILAEGYVERAITLCPDDLPLLFLPVQQVGWSEEHLDGVGTLTSNWSHLLPVWMDICLSVKRAGLNRIILINSHGGNVPLMDILMQDLRVHHGMMASATNWLRFGYPDGLFTPDELAHGIHGGAVETSLMLAFAPKLVDMEKADRFSSQQHVLEKTRTHLRFYGRKPMGWMATDLNPQGVVGDATQASATRGELLLSHLVRGFLAYAREVYEMGIPSS